MIKNKCTIIEKVSEYLPSEISAALSVLDDEQKEKLCEIRLRSDMPVVLIFADITCYITSTHRLTSFMCSDILCVDKKTINHIFNLMCRYSVYSYAEQIKNGFISLENGVRVGVYGVAVTTANSDVSSVRNVKGLNIRIPGNYVGCCGRIADLFNSDKISNVIICGPPASGKTTVLKDLCRTVSDRYNKRLCVIDERFEFESYYLGAHTDVLSGYPKTRGIEIAVRTLSPEIILLDEIGMNGEVERIIEGMNSGVNFVMSIHCSDKKDLLNKNQFLKLAEYDAIDYCVFLRDKSIVSEIIKVKELLNETYGFNSVRHVSGNAGSVFIPFAEKTC